MNNAFVTMLLCNDICIQSCATGSEQLQYSGVCSYFSARPILVGGVVFLNQAPKASVHLVS